MPTWGWKWFSAWIDTDIWGIGIFYEHEYGTTWHFAIMFLCFNFMIRQLMEGK